MGYLDQYQLNVSVFLIPNHLFHPVLNNVIFSSKFSYGFNRAEDIKT